MKQQGGLRKWSRRVVDPEPGRTTRTYRRRSGFEGRIDSTIVEPSGLFNAVACTHCRRLPDPFAYSISWILTIPRIVRRMEPGLTGQSITAGSGDPRRSGAYSRGAEERGSESEAVVRACRGGVAGAARGDPRRGDGAVRRARLFRRGDPGLGGTAPGRQGDALSPFSEQARPLPGGRRPGDAADAGTTSMPASRGSTIRWSGPFREFVRSWPSSPSTPSSSSS